MTIETITDIIVTAFALGFTTGATYLVFTGAFIF